MRITYFTDTPRIGGAERFLANLVAASCDAGHQVTVIAPQPFLLDYVAETTRAPRFVTGGRVRHRSASSAAGTATALGRALPGLRKIVSTTDADLVHVNNGGYPGSDLCRLAVVAARLAGVDARLLTVHSAPWPRDHLSSPLVQAVADHIVWANASAVHATTAFVRDGLCGLRGLPPALAKTIPYGVSDDVVAVSDVSALRARLVRAGTKLLVGMVSATGEVEKGHGVLVEALARTPPGIATVVVGPHPGRDFLATIHRLGLVDRVTVEGAVPPADVRRYLHAIDALVVPSTAFESLPLVILEAMSTGTPVIASRLSGIPEAVVDKETGRLFEPGSVPQLAGLLEEALASPELLDAMGRSARSRWEAGFSVAAMTTSMLRLYEYLTTPSVGTVRKAQAR